MAHGPAQRFVVDDEDGEISLHTNHLPEKDTKLQQTCEQDTLAAPVFPGFFTY